MNAGRLIEPGPEEQWDDTISERLPNVVTGAGGEISLVYLTRSLGQKLWKLRSAKLEIGAETGLPRMHSGTALDVLAKDVTASPLVVSANGEQVFAIDGSGQIVKHSIPR